MPGQPATALFQAFADATRLRVLCLLRDGRLCVGDLVALLGVPQPTASRHLAALRSAGLVTTEKRGLWIFYSLAEPAGALHGRLLEALAACLDEQPELQRDARAAARLRQRGGCCPLESADGTPAGARRATCAGARGAGRS